MIEDLQSASNPMPGGDSQHHDPRAMDYILQSWKMLTRSMNECASLIDVKVKANPVIYVPADFAVTPRMAELSNECSVQVRLLPRVIHKMGDVKPGDLPGPGLLYLPHPYIVPGGRFNEMYGWDSYFIILGLLSSGQYELALGMADNLLFEVCHYGAVLNANRTYYLTRSQPPFLTATIRAIYDCDECFPDRASRAAWLETAYPLAAKDYETWVGPHRMAGETGLSRYFDLDSGPVPELADDPSYFHDVIAWMIDHPLVDPGYIVQDPYHAKPNCGPEAGQAPLNPRTKVVRDFACVSGFCLAEDFYLGDRAMRESGFDSSFRFGPFCGMTHHFAPVCLNSLLFRYERDMVCFARDLGLVGDEHKWITRSKQRAKAVHRYLWREEDGLFMDYNFMNARPSGYKFPAAYYAMWAGLATKKQAGLLRENLHHFERCGGLSMSPTESGMQWDEPYGWAPCNWIVVDGLKRYGYCDDAVRLAKAFMRTVNDNFSRDGTMREKYDVVRRIAEVHVTAGYKENVIGFGWTNGVYLKMQELLDECAA